MPAKRTRRGPQSRSSGYTGVTFSRTSRWEAHIWDSGKQLYLGGYEKADDAARAYDKAAIRFRGPAADINFPLHEYEEHIRETAHLSKENFIQALRRDSPWFTRGSSRYRGVSLHTCGRWEARLGQMGPGKKYIYLGLFDTEEEAAMAYDRALLRSTRCHNVVTNFSLPRHDTGGGSQTDQAPILQGPPTPTEFPPPPRLSYLSRLGSSSPKPLSPRFSAPDFSMTLSPGSPRVNTSSRPAPLTPSLFAPPSFHTSVVTSAGAQLSPRAGIAPSFGHLSGPPELPYLGYPVPGSLSLMRQDVLLTERARQLAAYQLAQAILTRPQAPASNAAAGGWGPPERGPAPFANTKGLERAHLPLLHLQALSQLASQPAGSALPRGPLTHPALWQYLADVRMLEALSGVHHGTAYAPPASAEEPSLSKGADAGPVSS